MDALLQYVKSGFGVITGVGFTMMVACCTVPEHVNPPLANCGVTLRVAVTAAELLAFTAENAPIFPVPLAARPMVGVLLVHA